MKTPTPGKKRGKVAIALLLIVLPIPLVLPSTNLYGWPPEVGTIKDVVQWIAAIIVGIDTIIGIILLAYTLTPTK